MPDGLLPKERDSGMTLFIVRTGCHYEPAHIERTCSSVEHAIKAAEEIMEEDQHHDEVSVLAVSVGPGPGVVVGSWQSCWPPSEIYPCDGEGPPSASPEMVWERVL